MKTPLIRRECRAAGRAWVSALCTSVPLFGADARAQQLTADAPPALDWRQVEIRGMGFVTGLLVHPEPPHTVFAKTDVGGVYRFDRAAGRWVPMLDGLPRAKTSALDVASFATVPGRQDALVIVALRAHPTLVNSAGDPRYTGEVMRTLDGGATWQDLGLLPEGVRISPNGEYRGFTGERVAVDPAEPERMIVAGRLDGVWLRQPADGSWSAASGLPAVTAWVDPANTDNEEYGDNTPGHTFVVFDPSGGLTPEGWTRRVYVGDHATGVHVSDDGGRTFSPMPGSPVLASRGAVAPDGTLYVSTARSDTGPNNGLPEIGGVFRFRQGSWQEVTPDGEVRAYGQVAIDPADASRLAVHQMFGDAMHVSADGGETWQRKAWSQPADESPFAPPPTPENFFIKNTDWGNVGLVFDPAGSGGLWRSNGYGVLRASGIFDQPAWRWEMAGFEELVFHDVLVPPVPFGEGGADLLSACMDMVGFRHGSRNEVPADRVGRPLALGQANGMSYSAQNPAHAVFVGWDTWQPWKSVSGITSDNGRTWAPFVTDPALGVGGRVAMSATDPRHIVWEGATWKPVRVTFDGGATWQEARDQSAVFDPSRVGEEGYEENWWKLGSAWHVVNAWWQGAHLAADAVNGMRFYRYTWGQWHYTTDGGLNWNAGFNGWGRDDAPPVWTINTRLVPHPSREAELLIVAPNNLNQDPYPLYRTTDGGQTVAPLPSVAYAWAAAYGKGDAPSLPWIYMVGLPVSAAGDTALEGVYRSRDDGATWESISDPAADGRFPRAISMAADLRVRDRVYIATSGRGIFVGERRPDCAADTTTDGTNPGDPASGTPDGVVNGSDLSFYVELWLGSDERSDLTRSGTNPGDADYGFADGLINGADLSYYVEAWLAGCP